MIKSVRQLDYAIVLCDDFPRMKAFYQSLFDFPVAAEREDVLALNVGTLTFCLRKRSRHYDGGPRPPTSPGVQLAFRVETGEVDQCHAELQRRGIPVVDPPTNQFWGHRTVFFHDPEGNILEFYEDLPPASRANP